MYKKVQNDMDRSESKNSKKIVETAINLFKEHGYNNVSVNQICAEAGIARSSFYSVFLSKDDLILHLYSDEFTEDKNLMDNFVSAENDFERIWLLYAYFINLAMNVGPVVSASLMIIELNKNAGIYDKMMKVRKWSIPLCKNCQKLGIIRNTTDAGVLLPLVSASLNNLVFEWSRKRGDFPLYEQSRQAAEVLFDVAPEFRKS